MGMPVRLSDDLMELAKHAAEEATRSLTAQVEHWALIGRAVENALDHASLTGLKSSGGRLAVAIPDAARRSAVIEAILEAVRGIDRDALRQRIAAGKGPFHGVERKNPDVIVRYPAIPNAPRTLQESSSTYSAPKKRKRAR